MAEDQIFHPPLMRASAAEIHAGGEGGEQAVRLRGKRLRVVVVGAGAFGGWTALHLLRRGAQVTLMDSWGPGNSRSSSGGESRFLRSIYGRDRIYSEMVGRSLEKFKELETTTGSRFYRETGGLWMLSDDDPYVGDALPILEEMGLPVEPMGIDEAAERWPQIGFSGISSVFFERRAGVLSSREICQVVKDQVVEEGGTYAMVEVLPTEPTGGVLPTIRSSDGIRRQADLYVFCCGPWLGSLFPDVIGDAISPSRQEVFYFGPPAGCSDFDFGRLPGWIELGDRLFYGFPRTFGRGLKIADHARGEPFEPTSGDRTPSVEPLDKARRFLAKRFPALAGAPLLESRVCQYENSPDGHLIIDRHPAAENCWLVGGGSGHGFKLGPAVGEYVAQRIFEGQEPDPRFRLERFKGTEKSAPLSD